MSMLFSELSCVQRVFFAMYIFFRSSLCVEYVMKGAKLGKSSVNTHPSLPFSLAVCAAASLAVSGSPSS